MQKFIAHSLLVLFVLQLVGFVSYLEFERFQLKKEVKHLIKNNIPLHKLTLIKLTQKENSTLIWHDTKEFELDNKLFDVVRVTKFADGTYYYYVFSDKEEDSLMAHLNQTVSQNFPNEKQPTPFSKALKLFKTILCIQHIAVINTTVYFITKKAAKFYYLAYFSATEKKIELPPPKIS